MITGVRSSPARFGLMKTIMSQQHVICAKFTATTVRVYQAYRPEIAQAALDAGTFVSPFSMTRMTWIKPSFNWMMHRSGFASKPGQEMILGIDITRQGFEWALEHAILSSYDASIHSSLLVWKGLLALYPIRVQWDPGRSYRSGRLDDRRAIQIGLSGEAIQRYVKEWIVCIEDVTPIAFGIAAAIRAGQRPASLPDELEQPYPLSPALRNRLSKTILPG